MPSDDRFRESLQSLLYRYWFWEWLFVDMTRVRDVYQRAAAWRHNVAQRRHLPTYMRRWLVVTAANIGVAAVLEKALAAMLSAAFFYTNGCIAVLRARGDVRAAGVPRHGGLPPPRVP
jgi:hypothetical protein